MSTAAARVARHRARAAQGRRVLRIEVADALADALLDAGMITEAQLDDWDAVATAITKVLDAMVSP